MRMIYSRRKAKLEAAGIQPTLKHLIFFRTALGPEVPMQRLMASRDGSSSIQVSLSEPPSPNSVAAAAGAVDFEAVKTALAQQSQQHKQGNAELRSDFDNLQRELRDVRESNERLHAENVRLHSELSEFKQQQLQQQQQQHQAIASLAAQVQLLVSNNA